MNKLLHIFTLAMSAMCLCVPATQAIEIDDTEGATIYAIGGKKNKGVYTLGSGNTYSATKISDAYIQYYINNSGATFLSKDEIFGTYDGSGTLYVYKASSAPNDEGKIWDWTEYHKKGSIDFDNMWALQSFDLTYDPVTETVYGWFIQSNDYIEPTYHLATINTETHEITPISEPVSKIMMVLAADANGNLFGIDSQGELFAIDKTNGALVSKGQTGLSFNGMGFSAAIDPATGTLYCTAGEITENFMGVTAYTALHKVNLETAATEKLYDIESGNVFGGLYIPGPDMNKGVPAATENLAAQFTGTGNGVKVTFTAPTANIGGSALDGEMTYTILVDNVLPENGNGTAMPGDDVEVIIAMEDGTHSVEVSFANSVGQGPEATTEVLAGFDTPTNISNLKAEIDGYNVTLTWTAPMAENGGVLDMESVTYTITRNPGNVEVASGIKECTITDEIPEGKVKAYSFTVATTYRENLAFTENIGGILVGEPEKTPYVQNFEQATLLDDITWGTAAPKESKEWQIADIEGNKVVQVEHRYTDYKDNDNYLFSTPILFYEGITYTLGFKMMTTLGQYDDMALAIFLTNGFSTSPEDKIAPVICESVERTPFESTEFEARAYTFTVPSTGVYSITFHDTTQWSNTDILCLDDIEITTDGNLYDLAVKNVVAPEKVGVDATEDISVTVLNSGLLAVDAYTVELVSNGVVVDRIEAQTIAAGEEATLTFTIAWDENRQESETFGIAIGFDGDEDSANNVSEEFVIGFEKKTSSINGVEAGNLNVCTRGYSVIVNGAQGGTLTVFSADGRMICRYENLTENLAIDLDKGIYIVTIGETAVKVIL